MDFVIKKYEKIANKYNVVEEQTMTLAKLLEKMFNMINDNIEKDGWYSENHYTIDSVEEDK